MQDKAPVGVILAGGLSRRMGGGDKALLELDGKPLLTHVIERLSPQVARMALNANGDKTRFAAFGLPILPDSLPGFLGPLAGVLAGMEWAESQGADYIITAAADTPFLPCDLVPRLLLASEGMMPRLALAYTDGAHPTFGIWPVALRDDLRRALQDGLRKILAWTDTHNAQEAPFPTDPIDPFFNINTPDDLSKARAFLKAPL